MARCLAYEAGIVDKCGNKTMLQALVQYMHTRSSGTSLK
jgi:hypothetical protein